MALPEKELESNERDAGHVKSLDCSSIKRTSSGLKLEPPPSDDPDDPLNWPVWKKIRMLIIWSFASFVGISQATANLGGFVIQAELYGKTPTQLSYSISAANVGLAVMPFIWAWLSRKIGRTSVVFWAMSLNLGVDIWAARMTSPDQYVPFVLSRWLGGSFGSAPTTIGAGVILDIFYLHQRGKAFACYTIAGTFGAQFGATTSGYIAATAPWPVQSWWTVGSVGTVCLLFLFFVEDTTFNREHDKGFMQSQGSRSQRSLVQDRIATFLPGSLVVQHDGTALGLFDSVVIAVQPASLLGGFFLLAVFGWLVAENTLLSVFVLAPVDKGGYGFPPLGYANLTLAQWVGFAFGEAYGLSFNDRVPLWLCRRRGGIWKPEYRLFPLLFVPMVFLPVALGLFGASLQYHLHYMVMAFGIALLCGTETAAVPVVVSYMNESFIGYSQEITTAMNSYRIVVGITVPFYINPWTKAVGIGWAFGMMGCFSLVGFLAAALLAWKGEQIRARTMQKFRHSEEGERLFQTA